MRKLSSVLTCLDCLNANLLVIKHTGNNVVIVSDNMDFSSCSVNKAIDTSVLATSIIRTLIASLRVAMSNQN